MMEKGGKKQQRDRKEDRDQDGEGRGEVFSRRRSRPPIDLVFDYKDIETLRQFITEGGRIVAARISRLSRGQQRRLATEIKRARQLALLPISDRHRSYRDL
jgi:small subunit ribosomal protein S18